MIIKPIITISRFSLAEIIRESDSSFKEYILVKKEEIIEELINPQELPRASATEYIPTAVLLAKKEIIKKDSLVYKATEISEMTKLNPDPNKYFTYRIFCRLEKINFLFFERKIHILIKKGMNPVRIMGIDKYTGSQSSRTISHLSSKLIKSPTTLIHVLIFEFSVAS